jgi:hypothetical protein
MLTLTFCNKLGYLTQPLTLILRTTHYWQSDLLIHYIGLLPSLLHPQHGKALWRNEKRSA